MDYRFTERYYSILRQFRFTTSNIIGSYLFFSVEMGIPFFLYGNKPLYKKNDESVLANEAFTSVNVIDERLEQFIEFFSTINDHITEAQKEIVEYTLGLHDGISRLKMAQVLYCSFGKYFFKKVRIIKKWLTHLIKN